MRAEHTLRERGYFQPVESSVFAVQENRSEALKEISK